MRPPSRFSSTNRQVHYRPRKLLVAFADQMRRRVLGNLVSMYVLGFIGAGKSHMILAYATYMKARRLQGADGFPPVLYFSNYHSDLLKQVREAIAIAYPEDIAVVTNITTWDSATEFIESKALESVPLVVFDDWNSILEDDTDIGRQRKANLNGLCNCASVVYGISANCAQERVTLSGTDQSFFVHGLTSDEWQSWRMSQGLEDLVRSFGGSPEKESRFMYMTGLIPLVITDIAQYISELNGAMADSDEAIDWCLNDAALAQSVVMRGGWIKKCLRSFSNDVRQSDMRQHINMMVDAIGHQSSITEVEIDRALYDHRLFYSQRDSSGRTQLLPSCGMVKVKLVQVLAEITLDELDHEFTQSWASRALDNSVENPSVQGFAFELYALLRHHFFREFCRLTTIPISESQSSSSSSSSSLSLPENIAVHRFEGNYPDKAKVNYQDGCTCFLPLKWNLRYIDGVFRWVTKRRVQVEEAQDTSETAAAKAATENTGMTEENTVAGAELAAERAAVQVEATAAETPERAENPDLDPPTKRPRTRSVTASNKSKAVATPPKQLAARDAVNKWSKLKRVMSRWQ
jgi:hypothetical protein